MMMQRFIMSAVVLALVLPCSGQQVLYPQGAHENMYFGWDIDCDDQRLIVGSYGEIANGVVNAGANYIYRLSGDQFVLEERQRTPIVSPTRYGYSVAISGDWALVSKTESFSGEGRSSYFLTHNNGNWWAPDKVTSGHGQYGFSADIHGDKAVVGALLATKSPGYAPGGAVVYRYVDNTWKGETTVFPSDALSAQTYFGESVCISDDYLFVGAHGESDYRGAVYVYVYRDSNWVEVQKLVADDGDAFFAFGDDLDFDGTTLVVGASRDGEAGESAGAAYIFELVGDTFQQTLKLLPEGVKDRDRFGRSVAIRGNHIIVGASRDDEVEDDAGAAYLYRRDGAEWTLEKKVTHPDLSFDARFGTSVAINSTHYMIAGYNQESEGFHRGAVYVFPLAE